MNLIFILFFLWSFMYFCISSINVCDARFINENLDSEDESNTELSFRDEFNLHHAFVIEKSKWKYGVISFKIGTAFDRYEIVSILIAMYEIESSSCLRFVAHDPSHGPNYVMIKKHDDPNRCSADLGFLDKGEQMLNLGANCVKVYIIIHELLHTIGFYHHHQRSDRDKYIDINLENVIFNETYNFLQHIYYDERIKYLTPFDYNSIMLYHEYEMSVNNKSVITPRISGVKIEPSQFTTEYDKILLNRIYNCESVDKKKSKLFYENEKGMKWIVNYHEIERAKEHLVDTYSYFKNDEKKQLEEEEEDEFTTAQYEENPTTDDDFENKTEQNTENEQDESTTIFGAGGNDPDKFLDKFEENLVVNDRRR